MSEKEIIVIILMAINILLIIPVYVIINWFFKKNTFKLNPKMGVEQ